LHNNNIDQQHQAPPLNNKWQKFKPGGLNSRDQLLKTVENVHRVEINFFFLGQDFKNWDFSIETWLRRDFYQDRRDKSRFLRFIKIYQDLSRFIKIYQDLSRFLDIFWEILLIGICGSMWPSTDVN
jgi:hypothetical protein